MQVGDLVIIHPACSGFYVITNMEVYDIYDGMKHLPECVMVVSQSDPSYGERPMGKEWVEVVCEGR